MCENLRKFAVCALILQRWHPESKCRRFSTGGHVFWSFLFFSGRLGEIWAKMVLGMLLNLRKCAQHEQKCSRFFGGRSFSLREFFSGKFGEIWAKILRTPKNLPAPTRMSRTRLISLVFPNFGCYLCLQTKSWAAPPTTQAWEMSKIPLFNMFASHQPFWCIFPE